MAKLTRIALAAVAVMVIASLAGPAVEAACGSNSIVGTAGPTNRSFVWTAGPDFGYYGYGQPFGYRPPISANFTGVFWRQGAGDPAIGMGNDNGAFDFVGAGQIYYRAYPSIYFYYAAQIFTSWTDPAVDGCIDGADGNVCTCLLLTDTDGMNSYFALLGSQAGLNDDTFFDQPGSDGDGNAGPIILQPVPRPQITGSTRLTNLDVDVQVVVPTPNGPAEGVYLNDGCLCNAIGYQVKEQILARGSMPPSERDLALWGTPLTGGANPGQPQGVVNTDMPVTVRSECGSADTDVWLSTQLFFDSGFATNFVSGNATRMECGPNLADPGDKPTNIRPLDRPGQTRPKTKRR